MRKKKNQIHLGDTHLPADLLTPTSTTTYGLAGFDESRYGLGNLERVVGGEDHSKGPGFPTGLTRGAAAEMDLNGMMNESLANLDWLDPNQIPDASKLPKSPTNRVIPELVEAWGVHRRTDGQAVFAQDLAIARLKNPPKDRTAKIHQIHSVLREAARRSAKGHDLTAILHSAVDSVGDEAPRLLKGIRRLKAEHGLVGNVFIRASAYPGYDQGRWATELKKLGAKYVIVSDTQLENATWIRGGRCTFTGKTAVTSVPWKEAFDHYAAKLVSRVACEMLDSEGSYKDRLKAAFLARPRREVQATNFPTDFGQREASDAEMQAFRGSAPEDRQVIANDRSFQRRVAVVKAEIQRGLSGDLLKNSIRRAFAESERPRAIQELKSEIRKHGSLRVQRKDATYQGAVFNAAPGERVAVQSVRHVKAAVRWVRQSMTEGFAGADLDELIAHRLSPSTKAASEQAIKAARREHEGGSGFLYVDAEAYASPTGRTGCEAAAPKHRANPIKAVAEMPRCASCASVRTLEDGTQKCGLFNKILLTSPGTAPEFSKIKKANIRSANMTDPEQIQGLFGGAENSYDPDEFRLANQNLEGLELDMPEHDQVRVLLGSKFQLEF